MEPIAKVQAMERDSNSAQFTTPAGEGTMSGMQENQPVRVLLIEDDHGLGILIKTFLEAANYQVEIAENGPHGLELALQSSYSILIMDIKLPGMNGLEVLQRLRERGINTPILILSGMGNVSDRVTGLQMGGDDYLVKPFAFSELRARMESLLRRAKGSKQALQLKVSDLLVDLLRRKVFRGTEEIILQPQEFSLLEYLVRNRGRAVSRAEILQHVWGYNFTPTTNVVEVHVCRLREKLERPDRPKLLKTIRGEGYMFTDDVVAP